MRHGIIGAVALLFGGALVQDADARPNRVCEQWRDYHYNVRTGAFIEWVGEPYWVCLDWSDLVTYPRSPDPEHYAGGSPIAYDPTPQQMCEACKNRYDFCVANVHRDMNECKKHYRDHYERLCREEKQNRDGSRLKPDVRCFWSRTERTKPEKVCWDYSIGECIEGYRRDWPSISRETSRSVDFSGHFADVVDASASAGNNVILTWPSGTGFRTICNRAGRMVSQTCLQTKSACKRPIRGCR